MSENMLATKPIDQLGAIEQVLIKGNLSDLTPPDRIIYYKKVCESLGLNPLTKPFGYISFEGQLQLYAKKDCAEQLRKIHQVSIEIIKRETIVNVFVVTCKATMPNGRQDESIGAIDIAGISGKNLANAIMKAETKAKRRATLSICGLGLLDSTEVEDVESNYMTVDPDVAHTKSKIDFVANDSEGVTKDDLRALNAIMKGDGWKPEQLKNICMEKFKVGNADRLTKKQYQELLETIKTLHPSEVIGG